MSWSTGPRMGGWTLKIGPCLSFLETGMTWHAEAVFVTDWHRGGHCIQGDTVPRKNGSNLTCVFHFQ